MDKIHIKLLKARKLLGLTQIQIKDLCGIEQHKLSDIERGKSKFIPNEYMEFLHIQGIDLNTIFNDSFDVSMRDNDRVIPINTNVSHLNKLLADKENKIADLHEQIGELKYRLSVLRKQNGYNSEAAEP